MEKLYSIVGPTCVGKTRISIEVAKITGSEIVSCDSMQTYRNMNIGTDKVEPSAKDEIPHHMIDIVETNEDMTVGKYRNMARRIISEINEREIVPILVGGSGLYFHATVFDVPLLPSASEDARRKAETIIKKSLEEAVKELESLDPEAVKIIDRKNPRRVLRALEICYHTGGKYSELTQGILSKNKIYDMKTAGVVLDEDIYEDMMRARLRSMLSRGIIDEVKEIRDNKGFSKTSKNAVCYKEVINMLDGLLSGEDLLEEMVKSNLELSKKQKKWFKKYEDIEWFEVDIMDLEGEFKEISKRISDFFKN